jgi:hypothetical protein
MAQLEIDRLLERAKKGFTDRDANRQLFEDCYEYMQPFRNTYSNNGSQAAGGSFNKPSKQYDSTAMISAANFVNTMQANFTPVFTRWAELKAGPGIPEKNRAKMNKELSKLTDLIFAYLNASNFATASAEMYFDWGIGTGSLWLFEGDEQQPLNFIATPRSQMGLVEGKFGSVDSRFRQYKLKARLIPATYPGAKLNADLETCMKDKPDEEIELIEACYYDYEQFVWHYEVIHEKSKHRILHREYAEEICFTPRWLKIPGFADGVGPFILALLDVKTLNKVKEFMLRSAALNIFGVYTVANGGAFNPNAATLNPGTFIPVERNGGPNGPSIAALPRNGDFQMQDFLLRDLQDSVRKVMLDNRLPPETPQPKTAFEISQRIKEFQVNIGSAYGRAMFEFVQPLFKRIIAILAKKGLITLPEGFAIDNFFVQVQVVSPIAQTQAMEDVQKLVNAMQIVGGVNPQLVLSRWEIEKLPQWLTEKTGAPAALLRDGEDAQVLEKMIMDAVAQQVAAQTQGAPANAAPAA